MVIEKIRYEIGKIANVLNEKIRGGIIAYNNYLEVLKFEEFNEYLNETEDQPIKKAESVLGGLDEMIKRNGLANTNLKDTIEVLFHMINLFDDIIKNIGDEKVKLAIRNNDLIDIIIDLEKIRVDKLILQNPKRENGLKGEFKDRKNERNEHRIDIKEIIRKKKDVKKTNNTINFDEIRQIEEWTEMKIGNIIFDSNIDDWNINTSVFDQRILNKCNLLFFL